MMSTPMPPLSQPQARGLALWRYGIARIRSCRCLPVATLLPLLSLRLTTGFLSTLTIRWKW
jgi:hypothetical protein